MIVSKGHICQVKVLNFPSSAVDAQIQREKIRLINTKKRTRTPEDTLRMFSEVAQLNIVYLNELQRPENEPVIESLIDFAARIQAWLD
ncbi:MAG: hypothetical protein JAY88_14630 [Candidatus Thiodiazotropha lotti]|nr:hypothetical protein [Candidatus Thiodiazotropha lotti]MCW4188299.1 hypothetical protein [Candidatus Thiodiazotropha lotti]